MLNKPFSVFYIPFFTTFAASLNSCLSQNISYIYIERERESRGPLLLFLYKKDNLQTLKITKMMEKKIVKNYEAPQVEIIEVEIEAGFAASNGNEPWENGWGNG